MVHIPVDKITGLNVFATYLKKGKFVASSEPILYAETSNFSSKSTSVLCDGVDEALSRLTLHDQTLPYAHFLLIQTSETIDVLDTTQCFPYRGPRLCY